MKVFLYGNIIMERKMEKKAALSSETAKNIKDKLNAVAQKYGYKVYAVGGYVRDVLLGRSPKDLDCVAIKDEDGINAGINFATLVAKEYGYGSPVTFPRFGTAKITMEGEEVEFVAPRKEAYTADSRKPEVERGTLADDARRRDFTVNALYQDVSNDEIVDPTGNGQQDLKNKIIRVTDYENPDVIFSDDPLRALRAIRQSYALGFQMEAKTKEAIQRNVERLPIISQERIRDEFSKILTGPKASEAIRLMHDIGLTKQFLPELEDTFGVTQDSKYHQETVDEHILAAVDLVPADLASRLVALLHDISKPAKKTVVDGIAHFYEHEDVGAETAEAILTRMKFPGDIISEVTFRIKNHMKPHSNPETWGPKAVRRFMKDMGDYLDRVLDFAEVDIKSSKREEGLEDTDLEHMKGLRTRIEEEKAKGVSPLATPPLINGNELQDIFNKNPGPWIGELNKYLADLQLENPAMTKDEAIAKAKEYMETKDAREIKPEEKEIESNLIVSHPHTCSTHCSGCCGVHRKIIVATAGFNHERWKGPFYPKDIRESEKLLYFARHIPAVEINATEHLIPRKDVFDRWAAQTPKEFTFLFRMIGDRNLADNIDILFNRAMSTIGHDRFGAISIVIPENRPYQKGDVDRMYRTMPAYAYAFDLRSAAWINEQAYDEIAECGGTIVRNHLLGGTIDSIWDYVRVPLYSAMREANLGNNLKVFAMDHVLDSGNAGEKYVVLVDEESPTHNAANTTLDILKLLHKKYRPSPVDLSILPKQHGGPSDPDLGHGMNNSQWPSARNNEDPMNIEEEEAVNVKKKRIRNPGDTVLTPTMTFDQGVQDNGGLAGPASKVDGSTTF